MKSLPIGDLVSQWDHFAEVLSSGFNQSIYDYDYYLDVRDSIAERIEAGTLPTGLAARIHEIDKLVLSRTRELRRTRPFVSPQESAHFHQRIPFTIGPELRKDLADMGLYEDGD